MPSAKSPKRSLMILALICAVIVVCLAIGDAMSNNAKANPNANDTQLVISYSGPWTGNMTVGSTTTMINGTGDQSITVSQTLTGSESISATVQKADGSTGLLTLSLVNINGNVLNSSNTTAAHGTATVSLVG